MKRYIIIFSCILSFALNISADDADSIKTQADSAYSREQYDKAIMLYEKIAKKTSDYKVFYNLGCSYYRIDNIAKSILWLERSARLNPSDEDVQFNLSLVRTKTIDRITPKHEMIIVSIFKKFVNLMSVKSWSIVCISLFILSFVFISLFLFSNILSLRKIGLFMFILCILLCISGNICAYQQRSFSMNHSKGVVMSPAVTVKSTPTESGSDLFVIHEGTCVEIKDSSMKDWLEIQIADGKLGWVPKKTLELI